MKKLELTSQQEVVLVDLASKFFPECADIVVSVPHAENPIAFHIYTLGGNMYLPYLSKKEEQKIPNYHIIPWYEFCLVHLAKAMLDEMAAGGFEYSSLIDL